MRSVGIFGIVELFFSPNVRLPGMVTSHYKKKKKKWSCACWSVKKIQSIEMNIYPWKVNFK